MARANKFAKWKIGFSGCLAQNFVLIPFDKIPQQSFQICLFFQCAKALVYFDLHNEDLDLNATNKHGDTPLHLAARWGFGK